MTTGWYSSSVSGRYPSPYRQPPQSILKRLDRPFSSSLRSARKEKNVRFKPATWDLPPGNDMNSLSKLMHGGYCSPHQDYASPRPRSSALRHRRPTPWLATSSLPADDFHPSQPPITPVQRTHHVWNPPNPEDPLLFIPPGNQWNSQEPALSFSHPPPHDFLPATPKSSSGSIHPDLAPRIPQDEFCFPDYYSQVMSYDKCFTTPIAPASCLVAQPTRPFHHPGNRTPGTPKQQGTLYTTPVVPLSPLPGFPTSPYRPLSQISMPMIPPGTPIIPCLLVPMVAYSNPCPSHDRYITPRRPDEEDDSSDDDPESRILRDELLFNTQISWDIRFPPSSAITQTTDPRDWSRTLPLNLGATAFKEGIKSVCIGFYDIKHWRFSDLWGDIIVHQRSESPISTGQILEAIFMYFFEPLTTVDIAKLMMNRTDQNFMERARFDRETIWGSGSNLYRRSDLLSNTHLFSKLYLKHSTSRTSHFSLSIR